MIHNVQFLLNSLTLKLLNKKALRIEQSFPTQLTVDYRPLTIDSPTSQLTAPASQLILRNEDEAETVAVVTVVRVVVATKRDTAAPRIVEPTTTTKDAVRA